MVLSAEDIHNKKFSTKMRGYNIDEVNDYLDKIVKDYQIIKDENEKMKSDLKKTKKELSYYDDLKGSLNQSILVAQEAADKVKKQADNDAEQTYAAAQNKADDLINEATKESSRIVVEGSKKAAALAVSTNDFQNNIKVFRDKMIGMLQEQLDFAKNSEWSDLIDGSSYEKFPDIKAAVEGIDNNDDQSVNFESKDYVDNGTKDRYDVATVVFFPNGEIRNI